MGSLIPDFSNERVQLYRGDCRDVMPHLPDSSVDSVVTDPPYAEIDRSYGRLTESEWHDLMHATVKQVRRILKPTGSAVFILQPNYERVGRTCPWLWDFMSWAAREWNLIEDVYWWNLSSFPNAGCSRDQGLLRRSIKTCVWLGSDDCYRNQDAVLWGETEWNVEQRARKRAARVNTSSGNGRGRVKMAEVAAERGGTTPYNILPIPANGHENDYGHDHPARTPFLVCDWFVRYLTPPGGIVMDPFNGSSTVGEASVRRGCRFIGIDSDFYSCKAAKERMENLVIVQPESSKV